MTTLNEFSLVLNKSWMPIRIVRVRDALIKGYSGMAKFVDQDYNAYEWDGWLEAFSWPRDDDEEMPFICVCTTHEAIRVPRVIVLTNYNKIPKMDVKLTRRNLLVRDNFLCQYTGKKLTMASATMDHIVPKAQGGETIWTNVVLASFEINTRKGNRTPQQAGLTLLKQPKKPVWNPIYTYYVKNRPLEWKKFLRSKNDNETDE